MALSPALLPIFFFLLCYPAISTPVGFRVGLTHVDSMGSFTSTERLHRGVARSRRRAEDLKRRKLIGTTDFEAPIRAGTLEYIMDLAIGTPPLAISAIADTGSDLTWTQCLPCNQCFPQSTPFYDRSKSSSFKPCSIQCPPQPNSTCQACAYHFSYGDNSSSSGEFGRETFTFSYAGHTSTVDLVFGCGISNEGDFANSTGIVGLGQGDLSLVSQLQAGTFSYCLTLVNESISSPFFLGSLADLNGSSGVVIQSTPLIPNPSSPPFNSYYYLSLRGISVGDTLLPIPNNTFQLHANGSGGLIIDSGSSFTSLEEAGYQALKNAIMSAVSLPLAPNRTDDLLCYSLPSGSSPPDMPDVVFHFDGADMVFPRDKYMIWDVSEGLFCLTISGGRGMSILGNYQQQNMHILFDVSTSMLSFVPAQCDQL
ncbi:aspartic proteinase nepenthesin-2 [Canna indica]|uniref:Aspartic proteinase nepenthesin-2 n=1 Tax=Canna indica TaxID=4628 RepID=A0AAQ3QDH1_9LILI|nr:aspartic proteinase nepenthesin-2 [Canna indica]